MVNVGLCGTKGGRDLTVLSVGSGLPVWQEAERSSSCRSVPEPCGSVPLLCGHSKRPLRVVSPPVQVQQCGGCGRGWLSCQLGQ